MDARRIKFVTTAIQYKALGFVSKGNSDNLVRIDVNELGKRLKESGSLSEMMRHVESHEEFSIQSIWESSPTAIKILQEMRAVKNA